MGEPIRRYPRPTLAGAEAISTPAEALAVIRYLTGEWLADPKTFGSWAGGCYMEQLHLLADKGLSAPAPPFNGSWAAPVVVGEGSPDA